MLNTILLLVIIVLLLHINNKLGPVKKRDYVAEAMERDQQYRKNKG